MSERNDPALQQAVEQAVAGAQVNVVDQTVTLSLREWTRIVELAGLFRWTGKLAEDASDE